MTLFCNLFIERPSYEIFRTKVNMYMKMLRQNQ